MSVIMSEWC